MISSLAKFFMLVFYRGGYPDNLSWMLTCFTMGAVAVARIAIERDRSYALGYLVLLGGITFLAMMRFVGSPLFCIAMLSLIAYLADRIVHDCTLIDDEVDASGQGLMDSGGQFMKEQWSAPKDKGPEDETEVTAEAQNDAVLSRRVNRRGHQPGRTVMYLALGALPLFGVGQFFLRGNLSSWSSAQWYLAMYLFSSLSLLVTTSFLGLRRYLRQRNVDMPTNVSIGWISGGLLLICLVIGIAFLAPVPGQWIASIEVPEFEFLKPSGDDIEASQYGWGDEAAGKKGENAATTSSDDNDEAKEIDGTKPQEGAPPGDAGDGKQKDGPAGKQTGGDKQEGKPSPQEGAKNQDGKPQPSDQGETTPNPDSNDSKSQSKEDKKSDSPPPSNSDTAKSDAENSEESPKSESEDSKTPPDPPQEPKPAQGEKSEDSPTSEVEEPAETQTPSEPEPPTSNFMESIGEWIQTMMSLFKWIIAAVLAVIVFVFVRRNWQSLLDWWNSLWFRQGDSIAESSARSTEGEMVAPPRPFSSFRNPVGVEKDPRRVVVITFQAFEAWTREHGASRRKDETPTEFLQRVAVSLPHLSDSALRVVDAYNRIVYGGGSATSVDVTDAGHVWTQMSSRH